MCRNLSAIGWAMRVVDRLAKVAAHKGNQTLCNPLSTKPPKRILCATVVVPARRIRPVARVQTDWACGQYKIHQT